ncbi:MULTISPECIES: riboflavin synthase [unclassified Polynucleobacter]|uniref:riboflavin synthase n=1 Tax=unclassified Polynucleobacter TaxID=2640945 RepID=UPI001F383170|nr:MULTISPECIES: riboflavin synthase [unclassified Polynucleobacter]MCE7526011.1 riboflavin synthase [Polynucleobacter sp. IMCC 30228]MCE7528318.1 riboflavin synthase [Polynucleobacter sp. IMCC 29146]
MFTGIISAIGQIQTITPQGDGLQLGIATPPNYVDDVIVGDSIAIQGACMTVTQVNQAGFIVDISRESLNKTVGLATVGSVNLEKALRLSDRLGGHLVSGHVDGFGRVIHFAEAGSKDTSWLLRIAAPAELAQFLAYKGSIVVNGVSLTVNSVSEATSADLIEVKQAVCIFEINIIPHTLQNTTLAALKVGDQVNLEVDLIARYVARILSQKSPST